MHNDTVINPSEHTLWCLEGSLQVVESYSYLMTVVVLPAAAGWWVVLLWTDQAESIVATGRGKTLTVWAIEEKYEVKRTTNLSETQNNYFWQDGIIIHTCRVLWMNLTSCYSQMMPWFHNLFHFHWNFPQTHYSGIHYFATRYCEILCHFHWSHFHPSPCPHASVFEVWERCAGHDCCHSRQRLHPCDAGETWKHTRTPARPPQETRPCTCSASARAHLTWTWSSFTGQSSPDPIKLL